MRLLNMLNLLGIKELAQTRTVYSSAEKNTNGSTHVLDSLRKHANV